jgi:dihydrofolate reductase
MICSIFSVDQVGGMGTKGTLPWEHHAQDMKWFRELTEGHIVVMGRGTWNDPKMPKPLPGRINFVVSNDRVSTPGVHTIKGDIKEQLKRLADMYPSKKIFVLGGPQLIQDAKSVTDFAYVTHRKGNFRCETRIDMYDYNTGMRAVSSCPSTDKVLNFTIYMNVFTKAKLHEGLH